MLKQKYKKRILSVILSVSMVLGLMPNSVLAAEYGDGAAEEQTIVEERIESCPESTDTQEITHVIDDLDDAQTDFETRMEMESELPAAETEAEAKVEIETEIETEIKTEIKTEMESKADAVEENAQTQAALDTRIVIHTERLQNYISEKKNTLQYDIDKDIILAKYEESDKDVFGSIKSELQDNKNGYHILSIEVDGKEITSDIDKNNISYQWKVKSGDVYTDMTEEPQQAGDYKLVISLQAVDGVCQTAVAELDFTITKRQISIGLENVISVAPGTTVSDFISYLKENYALYQETRRWNGQTSKLSEEAKNTYIASIEAEVHDAHNAAGTALSNDTALKENCDYTVTVKAVLNDAVSVSNVIVDAGAVNIKMQNLVETKVKISKKIVTEDISKVYQEDKPIQYDTDIKDRITVSIVVPDKDGDESRDAVIEGAQPTLVWYDADKNELETDNDETKADAAPVDAGIYYLDFQYIPTGDAQNIYKESKGNYLKIVIEPAPLTLKPLLPEDGQYYTGMTAKDVLKDADYALYNAAGEEFAIDKETFWGVSYNNPDQTQAYEPVFQIVKTEKNKDGDKAWIPLDSEEALDASKFSYRIVFTGKKAVYTADGTTTKNDTWDVNGAEVNTAHKNYCIVTTEDALSGNYADVPVLDGKTAVIDISEILAGCKASENINDLYQPTHFASKVYDGGGLFENREAYKKAKVTGTDGSLLASGYDDALTYTWYRITRTEVYDEETGKQTGWKEGKAYELEGNKIPSAAGDYKLVVCFSDFPNGYSPSSKTLYYRIDKQLLVVALADAPTAHKGETIGAYMERVRYEQKHDIYIVPNNQYSEGIKTGQNLLAGWKQCSQNEWDNKENYYDLIWQIEEIANSEDNTASYTRLTDNDCFTRLDENVYRLGVELVCNHDDRYANYEILYRADGENQDFGIERKFHNDYKNITVKETGDTAIEITIDETKLASREKDYDAKPFYVSKEAMQSDVAGAIIIKEKTTGNLLEASALQDAFSYKIYNEETESYIYPVDDMSGIMVNAGAYRIEISYPGDAVYAPCEAGQSIEYTVKPLTVKAEPFVYSDLSAGKTVAEDGRNGGVIYDITKTMFTCGNMPEQDKAAFTYGTFPYQYIDENGEVQTGNARGFAAFFDNSLQNPAFHAIRGSVRKAGSADVYGGCIRYNTDYTVQLSAEPVYPYSRNYKMEYVKTPFRATLRGAGAVSNISINLGGFTLGSVVWMSDYEAEPSGTVTRSISVRAGIPYVSSRVIRDKYGKEIMLEGNYFPIRLTAPEEFKEDTGNYSAYFNNFVYKNSIEKDAGGYIIRTDAKNGTIDFILPVDKEKTQKNFEVIWENGYTQKYTIDVSNAVLLDDLTKAVAPKSIAFNGVNTKMAVGEEQQLDVKITKAQIGDVIYLDYQVAQGADVVSVTGDDDKKTAGYVTALKVGTATVEAVPVRLENGEKVRIPNAKTATVKITVCDVSAPAVKKLTALDNRVDITYVKPSDGYRREIYILEGGKKKEEDFKAAIDSMKNGNWQGIFASAPVYCVNETVINEKTKLFTKQITGLKANTEYTVYVRNVSAVRTIYDENQVAVSAKGVVKKFKTTAPHVKKLEAYFKQPAEGKADEAAGQEEVSRKEIAFSQKKEQLYVSGLFSENVLDEPEHASADDTDLLRLELPLDKKKYKKYTAPKLVYWLSPDETGASLEEISNVKAYTYAAGSYYRKTNIASIDKKGMITLKGTGTIYAHVYDSATGLHDAAQLCIFANADRVTGKGGKLAVGQGVWLSSLLTYYEGKTAILGYQEQNLSISDEQLQKIEEEGAFQFAESDGDYYITAVKPNAECSFTVIDQLVAQKENSSSEASLAIQSKPIEPVKNLKITDIADDRFVVNFSYPVSADRESRLTGSYVLFRIDITDARGSAVASVMLYTANLTAFQEYFDKDAFGAEIKNRAFYYDEAKKVIHFRCPYSRTSGSGRLLRLSNYKVSVIPIYGTDYSAKPAVKTVKTTNCPASYESLGKTLYGGQDVTVIGCAGESTFRNSLRNRPYLTSGNTYTLKVNAEEFPKDRMTDSLTWKSTNTKTATVKANPGTYSASLKAVRAGTTVIEVTSKITKKVIARYPIFVKAVGNARGDFYGDYEYKGEYVYELDPFYNAGIEVLTEANPVRVDRYELPDLTVDGWQSQNYKWVKFTAPEFGDYTFTVTGTDKNAGITDIVSPDGEHESKNYATELTKTIFQGQTYYFKVYDTFVMTVKGEKLHNVITETGIYEIDAEAAQYIQFIAAEDNIYTIWTEGAADAVKSISDEQNQPLDVNDTMYENGRQHIRLYVGNSIYLKMDAGSYTLHIEKRNPETLGERADLKLTDEVKEKWYCYNVEADGLYTVLSDNATSALKAEYFESLLDMKPTGVYPADNGNNFGTRFIRKAGEKIILRISAEEAASAELKVIPELFENLSPGEEKDTTAGMGSRRWVVFTLPEAGRYQFDAVCTEPDEAYDVNWKYYRNDIDGNEITSIADGEIVVSSTYKNADAAVGDTIYVEVTTNKEGETPANVRVALSRITAKELVLGEETELVVENGTQQWYTFQVPKDGKYMVKSAVTPNAAADGSVADTHQLTAAWYQHGMEDKNYFARFDRIGDYDIYYDRTFKAGSTVTFKVTANDLAAGADGAAITTMVKITAKEFAAEPFTIEQPAGITILENEEQWYSFTAPETKAYMFKYKVTEGKLDIDYHRRFDDSHHVSFSRVTELDLEEGQSVWFHIEGEEGTGKGTISATPMEKISGTVEKTAVVSKGAPLYYKYTANEDYRYDVGYTIDTEGAKAVCAMSSSIEGIDSVGSVTTIYGHRMFEDDDQFIKVSTESETPVSVTFYVKPIEPIALKIGTIDDIPLAPCVEPNLRGKYTWCSFTAEEPGKYVISVKGSGAEYGYYGHIWAANPENALATHTYEAGETVYVALYTSKTDGQKTASVTVEKMTPTPMSGSSVDETLEARKAKCYSYTAQKTGIYTFTGKCSESTGIRLYADIASDSYIYITGNHSTDIFLKENSTMLIRAWSDFNTKIVFSLEPESEAQTLSETGSNAVDFGGQDYKLLAFSPGDTGYYDFDIAYSGTDVGDTGSAYFMNSNQTIPQTPDKASVIYSTSSGSSGTIAFPNRLLLQGETVYFYIPKPASAEGAGVTVSKKDVQVEAVMLTEEKPMVHTFGDGDEVIFVFHVPDSITATGGYALTFERTDSEGSYSVERNMTGLNEPSWSRYGTISDLKEQWYLRDVKMHQRVCYKITKKGGNPDEQLTVSIAKEN